MAEMTKAKIAELAALVAESNPKDGSAPLGPVILIGSEVVRLWDEIEPILRSSTPKAGE